MVGVFLFVAIPLPLTGVWTGTAVAVFLGLGFWKSLLAVSLGNISSGLIMTGLSILFKDNLNLFLTIFMVAVLALLVINIIYLVVKGKIKKKKAAQNTLYNEDENSVSNSLETVKEEDKNNSFDCENDCGKIIHETNADNIDKKNNIDENEQKPCENRDIITKTDVSNIKNAENNND